MFDTIEAPVEEMIDNKITKKNSHMQNIPKNNHLMLGFESFNDFWNSMVGAGHTVINAIGIAVALFTTFLTNYVWDSAGAVYFMLFMVLFDAFTGIMKALKQGTFSSSRLPRILVIMVVYTTLLCISWNISKYSPFYSFLPSVLYGGFIVTLLISVFENLHILNMIPDRMYGVIKEKIVILQNLFYGDKKSKGGHTGHKKK